MTSTETGTEVIHHCRRPGCRRPLSTPESIARGFGPVCARKVRAEQAERAERAQLAARAREGFTADQQAKADAAIAAGKVRIKAPGLYVVESSKGTGEEYATDCLSCTCPAGARDRRCWHLLAARLVEIASRPLRPARPLLAAAA